MSNEKSNAHMFNLSLIETDMPLPDSAQIFEYIEGTQLAKAFELQPKMDLENTEDYEYTPPQNNVTAAPGMR